MRHRAAAALACGLWVALAGAPRAAEGDVRIKDITEIEGVRPNQLTGFGLVVGLDNTGGRSLFTQQLAVDMLTRFGTVPRLVGLERTDAVFKSNNVSAVMVTAELGPWNRRGTRLDVIVSVLDDATSLQGGTLILTPLRGADGVDYAVAQGPVSLGGFLFTAPVGGQTPLSTVQKNHPTVGRIPGGAMVEREARATMVCNGRLHVLLKEPDFSTAKAVTRAINEHFFNSSVTVDAGTVDVAVPYPLANKVMSFVADLGQIEVTPDAPARVVINERTGTIVAGHQVKIASVAVAHGNLSITTNEQFGVAQPLPFSDGTTALLPQASVRVNEGNGVLRVVPRSVTVAELAQALNALGATPRDLITIFQAIKQSGALHAELIIM